MFPGKYYNISFKIKTPFSYIAPCLLNRLPTSLKELDSIATNKSKLKIFMFERAFNLSDQSMNESYRL